MLLQTVLFAPSCFSLGSNGDASVLELVQYLISTGADVLESQLTEYGEVMAYIPVFAAMKRAYVSSPAVVTIMSPWLHKSVQVTPTIEYCDEAIWLPYHYVWKFQTTFTRVTRIPSRVWKLFGKITLGVGSLLWGKTEQTI